MAASNNEDFVQQLSPIDHLSSRVHIPKLLYFATSSPPETIYTTLVEALSKAIAVCPILGGSVGLMENASQTGTLAVQAPFFTAEQILTSKDLREQYDYKYLRAKGFPPNIDDAALVSPDLADHPERVLVAQVNYIRGGVILTCAIHHCVVDETGCFNLIKLWAAYCDGEDAVTIKPEWIDRSRLMTGQGTGKLEDHPEYNLLPPEKSATHSTIKHEYVSQTPNTTTGSAILYFSEESLERLKKAAVKKIGPKFQSQNGPVWISTNDALRALIWRGVTCARTLGPDVKQSMFFMAVDGRSHISPPISPVSIGNAVFISKAALPLDIIASSLPATALIIRKSILDIDDAAIRDKIKAVSGVNDIGRLAPGGYSSDGRNLGCTSWTEQPYYELNWGAVMGGRCKRVRWRSNISDGIFVIFPRLPKDFESGGGLEVYLGLKHDALERLQQDRVFNQYAEWRCVN